MTDDTTTATEDETLEGMSADVAAQMEHIADAVKALDPERRNLLLVNVLARIEMVLEKTLETCDLMETNPRAAQSLALTIAAVGLGGVIASTTHGENEDWTRKSDTQVDAVWDQFADLVKALSGHDHGGHGVVITPDDLPEGLLRRVADGNGTPEDHAEVKRVVAEKTGLDPDKIDVEAMFAAEKGKVRPVGAPQAAGPGKPPPFEPRVNDKGVAVDNTGHEYGGQYL